MNLSLMLFTALAAGFVSGASSCGLCLCLWVAREMGAGRLVIIRRAQKPAPLPEPQPRLDCEFLDEDEDPFQIR